VLAAGLASALGLVTFVLLVLGTVGLAVLLLLAWCTNPV